MKKLLITGASGFLGWHLCQKAQQSWEVYGTYFNHKITIPNVDLLKIDLTNFLDIKTCINQLKPDGIIHLAAASKPNYCQIYPQESAKINIEASVNIANLCSDLEIPCIFTSTDLVFDGLNAPYKETDPVSPISYYGEQKVKAEQQMLAIYPKTVVCRMPLMFGLASPTSASFIDFFINTLKEGKELSLFIDEFRTPVSSSTAADGLLLALQKASGNILHLGGKERISRYQFGLLMAQVLGLPSHLITPCQQQDVPMAAPRSPDTSLDSSKAFSLGYNPLSLKEQLNHLNYCPLV
ncbi:dTDP-4-dehydrorhamnose reductase [Rippkaea orientalis PCC 8801]|uniref:dTDP-4-dehydrorhamnose reductase n=1 Tax=Rippkaea orientalis (strain PCC 8801 / RF-1) TaxID=41431 RepID=B7K0P6_RIPO1|nr:NAD(P)-dependent oxidoreductase [Rippkaea orientalis]ACK64200.1 dTDP-4-dehydrorhamnose reductase [Rippkaea orientalis PCC 8801]